MSCPIKNGGSFHSYVSLPEGTLNEPWLAGKATLAAASILPDRGKSMCLDGDLQSGHV